ncbi:MAG: DUF4347 domain-containing protein, partial [Lentisphaerae bacterium]|nr:DUF4347 domain-containing protein [Lentisphaerota bacterium]
MGKKRNKVEIFKLEDRVLFEAGAVVQAAEAAAADQANNDAAGDGSAAAEMQSDNNQTASNELTPDHLAEMPVPPEMSGSDNAADTADADAADFAAADPESETVAFTDAPIAASETSERILVVLNSSVADADSIVNDLGDNVEVLRLTSGTDALDAINDYLDEHADTKYSAIHLVSHGSEGYITLNGEKIDSTTINPADWKAIGEHLTDDADILVYGCDTAKSEEGKALVQTIANLTGADVAASIDSTGANGDWDLEYRSGLIEAATINPVSYQYCLESETPSLVVTTALDVMDDADELTSLREAIAYLNQNGTLNGENTITFAESLSGETITLSSTIGNITKSMIINGDIDGDGTADVTVDADQKGYFFDLTTVDMEFTINGLILTNSNYTADSDGGAINLKANGITLNVIDSRIENSTNTRNGATIFIEKTGAEVNIIDSVFNGNTSTWTGAVVFVSSVADFELNVSGSTISNNIIKGTTTHSNGGAIFVSGVTNAKVTITDSVFENNKGTGANGDAGISGGAFAYYNASKTAHAEITITGSQFTGNRGASGGALSLVGKMTALLDDNTFTDNSSRAAGGAIYHGGYQADVTISNSIFTGNHADGTVRNNHGGGAIFISSMDNSAATTSVQILNNTFTGNSTAAAGGAIAVRKNFHNGGNNGNISFGSSSTTFLIHGENLTFKDNSAEHGGALLLHADKKSYIEFTNSLFDGNTATKTGGAIHLTATYNDQGFTANLHGLTIINNSAGYSGGAIAIAERADLYLSDSTVVGNRLTTTGKTIGDEDTSSTETAYFGGAGIYKGQAYRLDNNNGPGQDVFLIHNIIADNTLESNGSIVAHDIYSRNGILNSVANIYSVGAGVTKIGGMDYVDADYAALASALFAPKVADKYVVDSNGLLQVNELTDETLNTAVNRNGFQLGTYQSGTYGQLICYSVDGGLSWNDAKGVAYTGELLNIYMADQTGGARVPYSTAGAAQYKPALMWSKADDGTITHWSTIADAKNQLESGSGEYFFAPTMQDFGDVAVNVNGSLILHGYNPDSELKINLILDSATDAVTVDGMKFTGDATLTAGSMTIENALLTGEGDLAVTNGVLTILNSTVYNFGGTITIDAANGIGQIVNSTLYGNSGTITGNDKLNILNSLVFGTENLSGYTAKYSVFDGTGTAATNTYSVSADDVFGTELVWDGLILTALQATPNSTAPHVNGVYTAMNGTNLYYSTDKVNWKNFADDSAATVDDAYIIKTDGLGNTRVVIDGKAVAGAYSALKEAGSLTVTIAADIVDPYDELISLREAIQYLKDGYRDANGETVITFDLDAIKAATGKYAYRTLTDGSIRIDVTSLDEGSSNTAFIVASGVSYTIDGQDTGLIIDISLLGKNRRLFHVNGGTLTLKNITLYGSGSNDSTGELDLGSSTRYDNISGSIICVDAGNLNADHVTFARSNHSMHGNNNNGGAALWLTSGVATVTNSTFRDNYGISVKVRGNGKHVLDGITFTGNTGDNDHGLIEHHDNGANVTYRNFTITGNTIPHVFFSHRGEPIYASNFVIYDNTFKSHVFRCHGAASLYNMTVTDNNITGSVFQFDHGTGNTSITQAVYNSTVAGNYGNISAIVNITGANEGSSVAVFDNTFAGNVSTNTAFASVYSASTVTKSIFIANNIFANDAVMDGVGEAGKTYYGTAYDIDVAAPKTYLFHNITGGKYSDAMTVTVDASNVTGTYAELFGAQTPVLDVENGVHTLAISKDGAATTAGVLVGRIGNAYYFVRDGVWHNADGTVYQVDDGTGTMVDVAFTTDAATNYGLGTASGTVVYTTAQNEDTEGNAVSRLIGADSMIFNAGAYALSAETPSLTVNTDQDILNPFDGLTSLHEALAYANKTEGAQTITFDSTVFTDTTTEYVIDLATTLLVTDAVTISNTTGAKIVLNGGNTIRVMEVGAATTIDGLIFRNGYMEGDLRTNANDQLYGGGGAIFAEAALTVKNSTFENNSYKDTTKTAWYLGGGAIFAIADVTVENSSFTGNYVNTSAKSVYDGGSAIHIVKAGLNVVNSTFQNHVSGTKSGVVMSTSGTGLTITDSTISGNTMHGVHLAYSSGTQTIKGTTFSNNSHTYAAAIQASISGLLTVNDCTFTGNTSTGTYGGVVKYNGNGTLSITDSTFENNISTGNTKDYSAGGAVYYSGAGKLIISGSEFTGNQVTKATNPVGGGAIYANFSKSGSMTVTDSTFSGNSTGTSGGAIYLALANGSATITNNTFTDNTATGNGGAIYLSNTSGTNVLADNTFTDNSAATQGGAVYIAAGETSITGSTFKGNSAVGDGGALHTAADTTISNSIFGSTTEGEGNSGAHGMTIYQAGGAMVITNSSIVGSTSTTQWADIGAIYANGTSLALYGVQITDNKANGSFSNNNGGGVVVKSGTLTVDSYIDPTTSAETKTTIARNLAGTHGGGIYFAANTSGTIKNAVFDSNTGAIQGGGAIYGATGTTISIENTHFNNNSASGWGSSNGGAINFAGTSLIIKNSLFSGNGATNGWNDGQAPDSGGGAIYVSAGTVDVINSTFYNNLGRVGNGFQVTGGTVNLVNSTMYSTETTSSVEITGGTFNAINSIVCGTVNGTLNNINSVVGADAADIFTSTTLTADNTLEIKADSAAAYAGALVGQLDGAYYYMDNGKWFALDGTEKAAFALDADTGYGLGADATIYTTAQNVDAEGNAVSRLDGAKVGVFTAGAHALPAETPSLTVNTDQDILNPFDGLTSLREALQYAADDAAAVKGGAASVFTSGFDATAKTYTINFADTVTKITVGSTLNVATDAFKTYSLIINGAIASGKVILDGGNTVTFNADGSYASHTGTGVQIMNLHGSNKVTLNDLILQNGLAGSFAGGVHADSGTLNVNNSIFRYNVSSGSYNGGAALVNGSGTTNITGSLFEQNVGTGAYTQGGAFYTRGTAYISDSTFVRNWNNGLGGAIFSNGGYVHLLNSTIADNRANSGGAILLRTSNAYLINSTITGNTTVSTNNGAIGYSDGSVSDTIIVLNSIVAGNSSNDIANGNANTKISLINSVYGSVQVPADFANLTVTGGQKYDSSTQTLSDIFETVADGKAVATVQTVNGVDHEVFALNRGGLAAQSGTLIARTTTNSGLHGTRTQYYYLDMANDNWICVSDPTVVVPFSLTSTDGSYGLQTGVQEHIAKFDTATNAAFKTYHIFEDAQNVDENGDRVDRLYALKLQEKPQEIFQVGAYAFNFLPKQPIALTVDGYSVTNTYGDALVLTETKKEITVTVDGVEKTYYLDLVWKTNGTVAEDGTLNVGTYEDVISIDSVAVFEKDGENYVDVTDDFELTLPADSDLVIGKATLTVTADAKSITVGGAEPELTYTVDGLKNGDVFTGTLVRAEGTAAGVYAITLADGYTITNGADDKSANYDFTFVGADLSIKEAASLTVTTLDDVVNDTDGVISFREAFAAANNKTASLAVNGVYTITFSQSLTANYDSDGDTVMDSYRVALSDVYGTTLSSASITLVIDGSIGTDRVTIAGPGTYQLMVFDNGTITLQDMIITGGNLSTSGGAVKANTNGGVTIRNVLFTGNKAGNGGAAIYVGRGTLNIYDSEFTGNSASNGGVFYQGSGTLNVYNSVFTGNTGSNASVYRSHGGSTATFVNSVFYGNNSGPAFELAGANNTVTLIDCIVADNGDAADSQIKVAKDSAVMNLINTVVLKGTDNTGAAIQITAGKANLYYSVTDADYSVTANFNVTGGINNATFADTLEVVDGLPRVIATSAAGKNGVLVGKDSTGAFYVFGKNATGDAANWISLADSSVTAAFNVDAAGYGLGEGATVYMDNDMKAVMVETLKAKAEPTFFAGTYRSPETITLVVNDATDTANTSLLTTTLREALAFCTTVGTKYNIVFANGVNNEVNLFENGDVTIYMSSGKGYSLSGQVNVTIDGSGDGKDTDADGTNNKVILDGRKNSTIAVDSDKDRYRIIHAGNSSLTLKNMTMQYGYVNNDKLGGGAVYMKSGELTLEKMYFTGNQARNYNANVTHGGAVAVFGSTTVITDTVFEANKATHKGAGAGALYVNGGTVTITATNFIANTSAAAWSNGKSSGAVTFIDANFTVTNVLFSKNTLADTWGNNGGGGLGIYTSTGTITDATFTENKVLADGGSGSGGGAVYIYGGTVTIQDSTFTKNESATISTSDGYCGGGGAINVRSGTVTLLNSTFTENKATGAHASIGQGGAVSIQGGTVTVEDSLFDSNSSAASGGAIANRAKLTVKDSVFINNSADYGGGAIHYRGGGDDARLNVYSSTFYGNSAARGGAIEFSTRMYHNADVTIRQVTIAGNTATEYGGGLLFYSSVSNGSYTYKMNVYNSLILGNTSGEEGSKVSDDYYEKLVHNTPKQLKGAIYNSVIGTATIVSTNFKVDSSTTQIASGSTDYGLIFNGKASADYTVRFNKNYGNGVVELYLPARDILQIATTANPETDQLGNTRTPGENGKYLVGAMDKLFEVPSLVVNTTEDVVDEFDGLISLREAIAYQKADPTLGNTITFSDQIDWSTTDKTITLDGTDAAGNYLGQLSLTTAVTIDGSLMFGTFAQGIITIKVPVTYAESLADNTKTVSAFRVFNVSAKTTLRNMIVKGGLVTD